MSITYTPTTNFGSKDVLPANDPNKVIVGAEFTSEFNAIQAAFALAAPTSNPTFSGTATYNDLTVSGSFTSRGIDDNADATAITIDSSENVGIGTTAPSAFGGKVVTVGSQTTGGSTYGVYSNNAINQFLKIGINGDQAEITWDDGDFLALGTRPDSTSTASLTEYMRITSTGNVGINESSPSSNLQVSSPTGGNAYLEVARKNSNASSVRLAAENGLTALYSIGDEPLSLGVNNAEDLRIDSTGNVGIGVSDPASYTVAPELVVDTGASGGITILGSGGLGSYGGVFFGDGAGADAYKGFIQYNHNNGGSVDQMIIGAGNTEAMRITSAGNVGIGSTAPARNLTIGGDTAATTHLQLTNATSGTTTGDGFQISQYTTGAVQLWNKENSYTAFGTNNTEAMRIDSTGNVGINTTNPSIYGGLVIAQDANTSSDGFAVVDSTLAQSAKLWCDGTNSYLSSGNTGNDPLILNTGGGKVGLNNNAPVDRLDVKASGDDERVMRISHPTSPDAAAGYFGFTDTGSGTNTGVALGVQYAGDYFDAITIDRETQNVGIGTSNPRRKLEVANTGAAILSIQSTNSDNCQIFFGDAASETVGKVIYRHDTNSMAFEVNSAERARIDAQGALLVGTTSSDVITSKATGVRLEGSLGTANLYSDTRTCLNLGRANNGIMMQFYINGANTSGGISTTQGGTPVFFAASDERLKDNIVDHESELANVMSLRPTRWDWKKEEQGSGEGFIAQELEQTGWSDLVSEGEDGFKTVAGLGAVETRLIKAMQEQQAMIEALTAKVEALKNA